MILVGTGHQRAAKASGVSVGGTKLTMASWSSTATAVDLPTPNFTSFIASAYSSDGTTNGQSYMEQISGILSANGSFGGDWDAGTNPLDINQPPGLYPRDNLTTVLFYTFVPDGVTWSFPYMAVRSSQNSGEVNGKVLFSVSDWKSQGQFTMPVGSH